VKGKKLEQDFYNRPTLDVAKDLLGKKLVRVWRGKELSGTISEVEAYIGEDDPACHAARGKTLRNEVMFGVPGHAYVYFIYGMYFCLNVVTEREGFPAAVLLRGIIPDAGESDMIKNRTRSGKKPPKITDIANGPGKLCEAMRIDKKLNGTDLAGAELFICDAPLVPQKQIETTPRIGIPVGKDKLWRFVLREPSR